MKPYYLILAASILSSFAQCATTLFFHGHILPTLDSKPSEWILVKNGRVFSYGVGKAPDIHVDEKKDLEGKWLLPSLTDSHAHITDIGREKNQVDLRGSKSSEEVVQRIKAFLMTHPTSVPGAIIGNAWDQTEFPEKKFPTREALDSISKDQPVILYRVDGHAAWVNTFALKQAKLFETKEDPKGGQILRAANGEPTGILVDQAMHALNSLLQNESDTQVERAVQEAVTHAHSLGITSIHDMGASHQEIEAMRRLLRSGQIHFRFYEMVSTKDPKTYEKYLKSGIELGGENDQLTIRGMKLFMDGAMGSRGALFDEPYNDDKKNKGLAMYEETELVNKIKEIDRSGFQIAIHAIGSRANHIAINAMEKALGNRIKDKRPRLEHAQVLLKADIPRIAQDGIIASMQPTHCTSDMKWVVDRIGKTRARYSYAWKSFLNAKAPLAFGSDAPVESLNPFPGVYAAVTRQDAEGKPEKGFFPEERISILDSFKAFTTGAAFAAFSESALGDLGIGKWADFIVTNQNPLVRSAKELYQFHVEETYIAGRRVYTKTETPKG